MIKKKLAFVSVLLQESSLYLRLRNQKLLLSLISLVGLIILLVLIPTTGLSQTNFKSTEDLKQTQQQIETQQNAISKERDRLSGIEQAAQGYLNLLGQNLQVTDIQIQDYQYQLQLANKYLKELQIDLAKAEQSYSQKQTATVARLRFIQQQISTQGLDFLFKSQNLNDFLDRRHRIKLVYQSDRTILKDLKKESDRLNRQKTDIEQQKNQIALINQRLIAQKASFETQISTQQTLIQRLNTDRKALETALDQLEKDSKNISLLIQQRIAAANKIILPYRGTGHLFPPAEGGITSNFGWRYHPILGYKRFHSGLDFGASYGSTIRAAETGRVIFAGWFGGYGNALAIAHGNGIVTLYCHSSQLYVSEGATVEKGQAIAAVGSTGLSTGPHLHFEVRKDGQPVDPMNYL